MLHLWQYCMYHSVFCSFPASWIKGDKFPRGIPYNTKLSKLDKKLVKKFYGKPKSSDTKADLETPVDSTKWGLYSNSAYVCDCGYVCIYIGWSLPLFQVFQLLLRISNYLHLPMWWRLGCLSLRLIRVRKLCVHCYLSNKCFVKDCNILVPYPLHELVFSLWSL